MANAAAAAAHVFATGITGSGKSHTLRELFLTRYPRSLVIDAMGEHAAKPAAAPGSKVYIANDVQTVLHAMRRAPAEGARWQIIANIDPRDVQQLVPVLVPPVVQAGNAYPLHVRGMALLCDELDLIAPSNAKPDVVGLWRRGRHLGLSILAATQRPAGVSRLATAMCQYLVVCKTTEPSDVDYLRDFMPAAAHAELQRLQWQWTVLVETASGRWWLLDKGRKIIRQGAGNAAAG